VGLPLLYVVKADMHGRWDTEYLPSESARYGAAPPCPVCGALTGAKRWLAPLRVSLTVRGEGPADFAFFSSGDFLMTRSAVDVLREQGLSGLEADRSVEVAAVWGWSLPDLPRYVYPELRVGPAVDVERSVIVSDRPNPCDWCGPNAADAIGAIHIDEGTWEDVDLFVPRRLPGTVLATERFVDTVTAAGLTGIAFVPAARHRWDPLRLLDR
jgi:hypothetical protein